MVADFQRPTLTRAQILRTLRQHDQQLKEFSVRKIGLFGSYAKGSETAESDIDFLVQFEKPTYDNFYKLIEYLEALLGKRVEILTLGEFMSNTETQDAVVRNIEIIGEAVRNFPPDFRTAHPEVEWARIAGIRDRLIHQYFSVDWDIQHDPLPRNRQTHLTVETGTTSGTEDPRRHADERCWQPARPAITAADPGVGQPSRRSPECSCVT